MKTKIVGILVCTLLIAATVLPVAGTFEKHIVENFGNDSYSNNMSPTMSQNGIIIDQDLDGEDRGYTVLRVWGSHYEMGYARAELIGDHIVQELNLVKDFFGVDYDYYRGMMDVAVWPADIDDEINGMVDSLAITHPQENIDDLDVKVINAAWDCYLDVGCRSHTCWGRYVAEPIKTLSTRRIDVHQNYPIPRHHVLCARIPDDESPRWVSYDTPGFVATWSSITEYGTLVSAHAWIPFKSDLAAGRIPGQIGIRHGLTFATDPDVSTHLTTVYEELQNYEFMINGFMNYYAPEGQGGVLACDPFVSGPDFYHLRRPNESWHHGEAMITTNIFTDGATTPSDEDFGADEYYDDETPKTLVSHWDLIADNPPSLPIVNHHMVSLAYRGHAGMTILADGLIEGSTRTPLLEYEWCELFETPELSIESTSGGFGVKTNIQNIGEADATEVEYTITVSGGILGLIDKEKTGTISTIAKGEKQETESTGIILGLGPISITIQASCAEQTNVKTTLTGKQLLFFTLI